MVKEKLFEDDFKTIYGLYDKGLAPIGTMEEVLKGNYIKVDYYTLTHQYSRDQIGKLFKQAEERK